MPRDKAFCHPALLNIKSSPTGEESSHMSVSELRTQVRDDNTGHQPDDSTQHWSASEHAQSSQIFKYGRFRMTQKRHPEGVKRPKDLLVVLG